MTATAQPTLLLVDDTETLRYTKARLLRQAGFEVIEAESAAAALEAVAAHHPPLVLLDVNLPDMNGFEVCRRIKQDPSTASVLVLQMSATYTEPSDTVRALEGGADACLTEPIEPTVLLATVRALLRMREAEEVRDRLLARLEQEHELLTAVLQQMPAGVVVAEAPSGKVLFSNEHAAELDRLAALSVGGDRTALARALRHAEVVAGEEIDVTLPGGERRVLRVNAAPVRDRAGGTIAAVSVGYDVTAEKRAEQERTELLARERAARHEAEAANRAKDDFLAVLSHELRSPLNAILTWTTLLKSGDLDQGTVARALAAIERSTRLQAKLIADLLDVSRIITGKLSLELTPVKLAPVVEGTLESLRAVANAKRITLALTVDDTVSVSGDAGRLQQVLSNLVSNALKFTPEGGRVAIDVQRCDGHVEMSVTDSGVGIDPAFLPYVFDRFRQADASTTRAQGGLGLGLAIVRHLVELHGGSVRAESRGEGHGARLVVTLPQIEDVATQGRAGQPRKVEPQAEALAGIRILVVDDEPDARDATATTLQRAGASVLAVGSVAEGLASLDWRPTVVLSDIAMPGQDGFSLVRTLRARDDRVPAIALTAYASADDRRRVLGAGYDLYLVKPIEPADLVTEVRRVVAARAERRA